MEIPKIFWAFYDLFRRKQLSLEEFSQKTNLSTNEIDRFLKELSKNT